MSHNICIVNVPDLVTNLSYLYFKMTLLDTAYTKKISNVMISESLGFPKLILMNSAKIIHE
jgi:hypothetical protein